MDPIDQEHRFDRIDEALSIIGMAIQVLSGGQRIQTERLDGIIEMLTPPPNRVSVVDILSDILTRADQQMQLLRQMSEALARMERNLPIDVARAVDNNRTY